MSRIRRPRWGQHFLKDHSVCEKIADALSLEPDDLVIEIGPGRGAMTRFLARRASRLVAIEIDPELAGRLAREFAGAPTAEVVCADILDMDFSLFLKRYGAPQCYVFGNLPYYITSPIMRHLFAFPAGVRHMTLLMQSEVAERVAARSGSRAYGYLSVLAQINSDPRVVLGVPPGAFSPPPKVQSALVDFSMISRFPLANGGDYTAFLKFAQRCFHQKRKSLLNNLTHKYPRPHIQRILESLQLKDTVRAEQLDLGSLTEIFNAITSTPAVHSARR
jgi:16S rRNA (adenine1518-N6/adenine1519-N6)-dimethyltransferase